MKYKIMNCDVCVVGAGVSGVAAAVAAAKRGASVVLFEQNNFPGGTAVIAMHNFICGINHSNKGLVKKITDKIAFGAKPIKRGKVLLLPFKTGKLILGLSQIIKSDKKIKFFCKSEVVSVKVSKRRVSSIIAKNTGGKIIIKPKSVIDASGEGDLIRLSGAKYRVSPLSKRQLSGFSFMLKNIKGNNEELAWKVPYCLTQAVSAGKLPRYFKFTVFSPAYSQGEGFIRLNIPASKQERGGKFTDKIAARIHSYLRESLPEFRVSYITGVSPKVSNREGLRLLGEYVLREEDLLKKNKFFDTVACGNWPIEFWDKINGPAFTYLKGKGSYEIPLRSLKSRNINNLFAAGRCISVDSSVLASTRVLGTCISLGEAAGIAARNYARTLS